MMSDDIEKDNGQLERLEKLEGLVDRYTQSRSVGLWAGGTVVVINTIVLLGSIKLAKSLILADSSWGLVPLVFASLWVLISTIWIIWFEKKHNYSFDNKRDGKIEVEKEKVAIWVIVAYVITFLGPAIGSAEGIIPVQLTLTISLTSFGLCVIYLGKKQKDLIAGGVFGGLCLIIAILIGLGLPRPFVDKNWIYSYFATSSLCFVIAGLVAIVVVHIYNRKVLRKIKEMRIFSEQQEHKSDSQ